MSPQDHDHPDNLPRDPSDPAPSATAVSRLVQIVNPRGLHTRAAVALSRLSTRFEASVWIHHRSLHVSARSISALLMLGAPLGDQALVVARGPDAIEAVEAIERFFAHGFEDAWDDDP